MRIQGQSTRAGQTRTVINTKTPGTKRLASRILSKPEIIIALICNISHDIDEWSRQGRNGTGGYLLLRWQLRDHVIFRSTYKYVLLIQSKVLRSIHAYPWASHQHDVVNSRDAVPLLRRRTHR